MALPVAADPWWLVLTSKSPRVRFMMDENRGVLTLLNFKFIIFTEF
jgi:hypothetical protein